MRIPKRIKVIAIHGPSCSGKSAISAAVGNILSLPVRHCGDIVKDRVNQLGLTSVSNLPIQEHNSLDYETRRIALSTKTTHVIEGTYLTNVLVECSDIVFIRLACDFQTRLERMENREHKTLTASVLQARDDLDESISNTLFKEASAIRDNLEISFDTNFLSIDECALHIANLVKENIC